MPTEKIKENKTKLAASHATAPSERIAVSDTSVTAAAPAPPTPHTPPLPQQELVLAKRTIRPWAVLIAVVVLIGASSVAASYFFNRARHPSTSDAYIEGRIVRISPKV